MAAPPPVPPPPWVNLSALWQIVLLALLAGAGLPALFAIGLRGLAMGGSKSGGPATAAADGESAQVISGNPVGMIAAGLCFLVVLAAIGWGIWAIYEAGH
jgi:hypothetical protein